MGFLYAIGGILLLYMFITKKLHNGIFFYLI